MDLTNGSKDLDDVKKEPGGFVGLKNLGATCYVNSLLQVSVYSVQQVAIDEHH